MKSTGHQPASVWVENPGEPRSFLGVKSPLASIIRVFKFAQASDVAFELIGLIAAAGTGVAGVLVVVVFGRFMTLLSIFTNGESSKEAFMSDVIQQSLYLLYIGFAKFGFTYIHSTALTYAAFRITRNLRCAYLRAALSQEVGYHDRNMDGSIAMRATSNGKLVQSGIAERLGALVQSLAALVAALVVALMSQWKLALIVSCTIPALVVVIAISTFIDARLDALILKVHGQAGGYAESALGGIRTVHAYDLRSRIVAKYEGYLQKAFATAKKKSTAQGVLYGVNYLVFYCGIALSFWQGLSMLARGEITQIGKIFTVLFATIISTNAVSQTAPSIAAFSRAGTAASELFTLIDRKSEINPFNSLGEKPDKVAGSIDFEGLTFSYPTRPNIPVLHDFSLHVPEGKTTALVGTSGSGKSTIIGLLERWYDSNSGTIRLDGRDIRGLNLRWLRTHVRLVQQEPVLFNGSVFSNIASGLVETPWESDDAEAQMGRVVAAAKLAFAHDFITALPQGYHTSIGQKGGLLSGGQRQRIAIARSIISDPKVLLLDEATSALDPHAERVVKEALDNVARSRTTIVIAHKLATIRNADNIVVMSKGRIVEQGMHEDLVSQEGMYAALVRAQDMQQAAEQTEDEKKQQISEDSVLAETEALDQVRCLTREERHLENLRSREDYSRYEKAGIFSNATKLVRLSLELASAYIIIVIACFIGAAVYPLQALVLANMVDTFSLPKETMVSRGNFLSLMFVVMGIGSSLTFLSLGGTTNYVAQTLARKTRKQMFDRILQQDLSFFDRPENTVGNLISRLDSYPEAIFELMGFNVAVIFVCVLNVLGCSVMALAAAWKLGLVTVFAGLPPVIMAGYARIRLEQGLEEQTDARFSQSASLASESVLAMRTVSSLAIESAILGKYALELDQAIEETRKPLVHMMMWFGLTQSAEIFVTALGFWWGGRLISNGEITFYQFILSFMGIYFSGQSAAWLFAFSSSFTKANVAANFYMWLNSLQPTILDEEAKKGVVAPLNGCTAIEFENVRFSYPLAPNHPILRGVSLKIEPGQFVAFVGGSGCGKSTMVSLLERFYDPTSGTIKADNTSLAELSPSRYRGYIALVSQEPTLFPGSIHENIVQGLEAGRTVSDTEVEAACRAANAWDFICSLPDGLGTNCGVSGAHLSGGQRQRIAIARAVIRKPAVLLLDEATSALDTESERLVQRALVDSAAANKHITIAVAHRLSTVRDADKIFVFSRGCIVEAGTHRELLALGGMYAKMCDAQSLD